jgi:quercetin dioxygenase-like cupin family protein
MASMPAVKVGTQDQADVTARPDGVVVRRLVRGPSMDVSEYTVPRGFTTGASDSEISEKAGYVVSGCVEIRTADGSQIIEAGGAYSIPIGVPHQFVVTEDTVMVQVRHSPGPASPART